MFVNLPSTIYRVKKPELLEFTAEETLEIQKAQNALMWRVFASLFTIIIMEK